MAVSSKGWEEGSNLGLGVRASLNTLSEELGYQVGIDTHIKKWDRRTPIHWRCVSHEDVVTRNMVTTQET